MIESVETRGTPEELPIDDMPSLDVMLSRYFRKFDGRESIREWVSAAYSGKTTIFRPNEKSKIAGYELFRSYKEEPNYFVLRNDEHVLMTKSFGNDQGVKQLYGYLIEESLENNPTRPYFLPGQKGAFQQVLSYWADILEKGVFIGAAVGFPVLFIHTNNLIQSCAFVIPGTAGAQLYRNYKVNQKNTPDDMLTDLYETNRHHHKYYLNDDSKGLIIHGEDAVREEIGELIRSGVF